MKLLIVDDSMVMRNHIARLSSDGSLPEIEIVGLAANGRDALAQARRKLPDCITMDLTMPEMDGCACIVELARLLPSARILVVSALSDKATALRAIRGGAHGFVHKPFTEEQLRHALREIAQ